MSTAGKVLVVLIALTSLLWVVLASGVDQINRNGSEVMVKLASDLAKAEEGLLHAKEETVRVKDQTTLVGEAGDAQLAVLRARKSDVQAASSALADILNRLKYQTESLQTTVKEAQEARDQRRAEKENETKALADARAEVDSLMAKNEELTTRLEQLRTEFKKTFQSNVDMIASSKR